MDRKSRLLLRLMLPGLAMFSLVICAAMSTLWARTCFGHFDDFEWSNASGRGIAIRATNGDMLLNIPGDGLEPSGKHWTSTRYSNPPIDLHAVCDARLYTSARGNRCLSVVVPWWWAMLVAAVLPSAQLQRAIRVRKRTGRRPSYLPRWVAGLVLLCMVGINILPRTPVNNQMAVFAGEKMHGWPFKAWVSAPIDDGTTYRRWALGGLVANTYAAVLFSLIAASLTQTIVASVRWIIRKRRTRAGCCPTCSYNLTGNTSGICPECGTPTPAGNA